VEPDQRRCPAAAGEAVTVVKRIEMHKVSAEFYEAMLGLTNAAAKDLDPGLAELIKIRASALNGCAFCQDMHTHDARKIGINEQKLTLLGAWEEAGDLFTQQERAALALTEAITRVGEVGVPAAAYSRAAAAFNDRELGQVISMAVTINAWNRIGVPTAMTPPRRS
jgi:AhpD family alkylhydroperoxidase